MYFALALALIAGCASRRQVEQLELRVAILEQQVAYLGRTQGGGTAPQQDAREAEARALAQAVSESYNQGDFQAAREACDRLDEEFAETQSRRTASRKCDEVRVVGKAAPDELVVETWFQGDPQVDLVGHEATLFVFFEEWCPHCRNEMPRMQPFFETWGPRGLGVVGLTKVSRGSTDDDVRALLSENGVRFPVAKETGEMSEYFGVSGIPAAALVRSGVVVWRGHPAALDDELIEALLTGE